MEGVSKKAEPPCCHNPGIKLAQGARTGVTRIGKQALAPGLSFGVDHCKALVRNQGLPTHLYPGGRLLQAQTQWYRGDRADICGDLLAPLTVAAGGGSYKKTVLVAQCECIAINFEFPDHGQGRSFNRRDAVKNLSESVVPGFKLSQVESILKAVERHPVGDAPETFDRLAADALRGAIRGDQLGIAALKLL